MTKQEFKNFLKDNNYPNRVIQDGNNLTVGGWLDLRNTNITELPNNLTVGGGLDISNTQIKNKDNERKKGDGRMEEKIKKMRKRLEELLREENINFFEWTRIESYINQKYDDIKEKSTL